jgi:hypothetical protein
MKARPLLRILISWSSIFSCKTSIIYLFDHSLKFGPSLLLLAWLIRTLCLDILGGRLLSVLLLVGLVLHRVWKRWYLGGENFLLKEYIIYNYSPLRFTYI